MTWRVAKSLLKFRDQVNAKFPARSKASDGTIGDEAHASRSSDHNPWFKDAGVGIVSALDITHDPAHGVDSYLMAEQLRQSHDPRIKYIISNRRICSATVDPWVWRAYNGPNPHDKHVHISVKGIKAEYDDDKPWHLPMLEGTETSAAPSTAEEPVPTIKEVQHAVNNAGFGPISEDGIIGKKTLGAIFKALQSIGERRV